MKQVNEIFQYHRLQDDMDNLFAFLRFGVCSALKVHSDQFVYMISEGQTTKAFAR